MCLLKQYQNFISSVATPDLLKMRFIDTLEDAMISLFFTMVAYSSFKLLVNIGLIKDMNMGFVRVNRLLPICVAKPWYIKLFIVYDFVTYLFISNMQIQKKSLHVVFISCVNVLTNLVVNAHL